MLERRVQATVIMMAKVSTIKKATQANEMIAQRGSPTPGDDVDGVGMVVGGRGRLETETMLDNGPTLPASSQALIINE